MILKCSKIPLKLSPQNPAGTTVTLKCDIRRFASLSDLKMFQSTITINTRLDDFTCNI